MAGRRLDKPGRERDDLLDAPARGARTIDASRPGSVSDHLLSLQRSYGNAAVTVAVQRRPRDRPQPTDAPGRKAAPKKKAPAEDYAPTASNPKFSDWTDEALSTRAGEALDQNAKNSWYFAAELYEEYWFRHKGRALAAGPYRAYKKLGDGKREKFWLGVMQGTIKPGKQNAEDQTGKEF